MNVHFSLLVSMDLLFLSVFRGVRRASIYIYIYIYDPGSAGPPPSPAMVPATPWCGVVWSGGGLLGVVPLLPPVAWCGFGFSCGGSPAFLGLLWVFGILIPTIITMMMGTMITIIIINSNILVFLWLVVGWPVRERGPRDSCVV